MNYNYRLFIATDVLIGAAEWEGGAVGVMSLLLSNMRSTSVIMWWGGVTISYSLSEQLTVFIISNNSMQTCQWSGMKD